MRRYLAEFMGTLILVLFGCGAAVLGGDHIGQLGIALAFGLAIVAGVYGLGPISGGHFNPAVSLAVWISMRLPLKDLFAYWAAQVLGAVAGAALLAQIAGANAGALGANAYGGGDFGLAQAAVFEVSMTAIFVLVILGATDRRASAGFAGLAVGLTLAVIHIVGIQVTGVSVNPARSFGPAILVGGDHLAQLWLFIVAPLAGGALGAAVWRWLLEPEGEAKKSA